MLYLNTKHIESLGINWGETIDVIEQAVVSLDQNDVAQPIKPYLRFRDPANRIIAMPAFIGGEVEMAGIKWIASFPKNIEQGIQRAHSMTILNDAATGKPVSAFNTALVSGIRTASVTGLLIKHFEKIRPLENVTVGILGFGPIGQLHLQMVTDQLGDRISKVLLCDINGVRTSFIPEAIKDRVEIVESWEEVYSASDVFITCTVSPNGYIAQKPKDGALLLNVSLRDFKPEILDYTSSIIVDEWEEVCREKTDIETMHLARGLQKEDTKSIADVVCRQAMAGFKAGDAIMFNPMGMAIFDIAIATYYYRAALANGAGVLLED
ncbi:2,3-diaminopropionate biosynthesis protein SbnB [Tumebacillus algifaecis]|uniref:2,3-diaminopropionate biosynthesis protein SbnB n=1 Tax=Tumebacillus algifaecis TaxID=1214604 RepID=A0A223CY13_9BACL|nr:2,3-diaminopropionate biosynthesis protein SbnB [Tumebacillus algifaecis]ASS74003.1 2,3-diaminopropionate biosynthesis protein SbnB [Tumebacillus algifaecis]